MTGRIDPGGTPTIDVVEADRRRRAPGEGPRPLLVDVREMDEIAVVRAEDVVAIPMSQFAQRFRELPDDLPLMIICASGGRSGMATAFLASNGYRDAVNVAGGTHAWERQGLPVRRGPLSPGEGDLPTR